MVVAERVFEREGSERLRVGAEVEVELGGGDELDGLGFPETAGGEAAEKAATTMMTATSCMARGTWATRRSGSSASTSGRGRPASEITNRT